MSVGSAPFRKSGQARCWGSRNWRNRKTLERIVIPGRRKRVRTSTLAMRSAHSGSLTKIIPSGEIIMAELTVKNAIEDHQVVSNGEWLAARKELLRKEKEFTRHRDQVSQM